MAFCLLECHQAIVSRLVPLGSSPPSCPNLTIIDAIACLQSRNSIADYESNTLELALKCARRLAFIVWNDDRGESEKVTSDQQ
jgi:hypothetical protein